ncbi:hypothetical protein BJ138DRAFT_1125100 [Hygrophoropsis aurantiaca]|uniref:Uncharacterized protein n=1 Tax=Hygrophoropsis aurantiaca TaxID=72124 RepID=A0ACB8AI24_9AGAM|nr:hypothetical protein BJ138DRAFT_1125100 [Hygrophoropsis aurantiaca]
MQHETADEYNDTALALPINKAKIASDDCILPQELKELETESSDTYSFRALWKTPFEIWREIFQQVIPPSIFLDSSLCRGPRSLWCHALRTKKDLISVCKTWYNVGIHLLYQQIVLRRFPQIYSLLQCLALNSDLGPMIKDITVSCFVLSDDSPLIKSELNRLLNYCPLVSHFTLAFESPTRSELYSPSDFLAAATHMLSNITHLEFGPKVIFSDVVPYLTHCKSLISLTFDMHGQTSGDMATEVVDLPMLETLQISWDSKHLNEAAVLGDIAFWSMPRLHRFTIHQTEFWMDMAELYYFPFLKKYGPALSTLCVAVSRAVFSGVIPRTSFVQSLLDFCPNLEHLAIFSPVLAEKMSHKTLKWIDIWASAYNRLPAPGEDHFPAPDDVEGFMKAQDFPMLRGVRTPDWALPSTTGPALHLRVPPNMIGGGESMEWLFPGVHVRHDPGHLYRRDLDYVPSYFSAVQAREQSDTSNGDGESTDEDSDTYTEESDWYGDNYSSSDHCSYTDTEDSPFRPFAPTYSGGNAEWESESEGY